MTARPAFLKSLPVLAILALGSSGASAEDTITSSWFSDWGEVKYEKPFDHLDYVNPDAPKGGEIVLGGVGTFDSMNPYATLSGTPAAFSSIGYESIMTATSDDPLGSYCLLCETLEYPETQDWVIFHLRHDVTFSDGSPMTAEDIAFSFNLLLEQGTPSYRTAVKMMIPEVEVIDDYTIKFTFNPDMPKKGMISQAGSVPAFQKKWYDETGARLDEKRYEISPGTGPYVFSAYKAGEWVEYTRNPDYWGKDLPIKVGTENFDKIKVLYFGDTIAAFEAFKSGEITFRLENSSLNWATGYDFPALDKGYVVKAELPDGSLPAATGFVFNLRREKLQDINLRKALGLMYNFTWTNETLQYGLFAQRESFWENDQLKATGLPEGRELEMLDEVRDLLPPEIFTEEAVLPHTSGEKSLDRRNMRKALALMAEAGYTPGDDGKLRDKDGKALEIEFLSSTPTFDRILIPYVENLTALGVTATYNRVDPSQYQARTQSFDYDIIYDGYNNGLEEGQGLGQRYGSDGVNDIFNPAGYSSEAVDKLIDMVIGAKTYEEMAAGVRAIDRVMRHDYFIVPAWYLDKHWVAYYDMYEHPPVDQMPPYDLGYLDFWWYNADKAAALRDAGAIK